MNDNLRALLAIMKSAKEKGVTISVWHKDIEALEKVIAKLELELLASNENNA